MHNIGIRPNMLHKFYVLLKVGFTYERIRIGICLFEYVYSYFAYKFACIIFPAIFNRMT